MALPAPLLQLRSRLAALLGVLLRLLRPLLLRGRRFCYEIRARSLLQGRIAAGVQFIGPIDVEGEGLVEMGAGCRIGRRAFFESYHGACIHLGEAVTLNDDAVLVAYAGITIGAKTMIGEKVSIRDANHGIRRGQPVKEQPHEAAAIIIGRDVWIGRGAFIGRGVHIADGAVVGANSVVTRDVAANAIVAGAPARAIGERREETPDQRPDVVQ